MKSININQIINTVVASNIFTKSRPTIIIILSIIIVWQLIQHGDLALGALMFLEKVGKKHGNGNDHDSEGGGNVAEEVLHIVKHGNH